MTTKTGSFITLEGSEGVGKTTNLEYIKILLDDAGIDYIVTREPGGTALGESLRDILLGHQHEGMASDTELLLMFAARAEHIDKLIRPALQKGQWVLCDRFTDATYAYQGGGRGLDMSRIAILEDYVQGDLRPDLTILLDAPVEIGRQRAGQRSAADRFEKEQEQFFNKVRATYLKLEEKEPERIKVVDASVDLGSVQSQIAFIIHNFIQQHV